MPRTRVLLNFKAHQLGWLKTKYSEFVKYALTNYRLLNYNGVLYRELNKNIQNGKGNIVNKKTAIIFFYFEKILGLLGKASQNTSSTHNRLGKGECHKRSWNQRSHCCLPRLGEDFLIANLSKMAEGMSNPPIYLW